MNRTLTFVCGFSLSFTCLFSQNLQWQRHTSFGSRAAVNRIGTDQSGNVYGSGFYWEGSNQKGAGIFVSKYSASGQLQWCDTTNGNLGVVGFNVDKDGNSYLLCSIFGNASFGSYLVSASTDYFQPSRVFVKYDNNGNVLWAKTFIAPKISDIRILDNKFIYMTGTLDDQYGAASFGNNYSLHNRGVFL